LDSTVDYQSKLAGYLETNEAAQATTTMDVIISLAKRRGFVFQTGEIYGGFASTWDYGPLGTEMKRNIRAEWWRWLVQGRDDMVGLDSAILQHPRTWEASGHLSAGFSDLLVDCRTCKLRFRADHIPDSQCGLNSKVHPGEDKQCSLTEPRQFNLMFKTFVGPVEEDAAVAYLRPETAQGIFTNFVNVQQTMRRKLPFGIAQQGTSFRNEITPGNFIFRTREFEQMEMEFFVKPGEDVAWLNYWAATCFEWFTNLGVSRDRLRLREHDQEELAHYSNGTYDVEYLFPIGWSELMGIADRTDFDLRSHQTASGRDLSYFDEEAKERYLPYVVEPALGLNRALLTFLIDSYAEEPDKDETRVVLRLHPRIAPIKVAILPLSKKDTLTPLAKQVHAAVRAQYMTMYDESQSIGKRYRRQDEIGTPLCVTIDFDSLTDNAVTIRERDSMSQIRVAIPELLPALREKLGF